MTEDDQEEQKRQLQKLLREYDANAGMAGFVCGRPVEIMPEKEQDRIINGFCTAGNLRILEGSREKLLAALKEEFSTPESEKIGDAVEKLEKLHALFSEYRDEKIDRDQMRERGRLILERPIPESKEGLIESLSNGIKAVNFLSSQPIAGKDSWDQMIDCAQLHDALSRAKVVCGDLLKMVAGESSQAGAIGETARLAEQSIQYLESYFRGEDQSETLKEHFSKLYDGIQIAWGE